MFIYLVIALTAFFRIKEAMEKLAQKYGDLNTGSTGAKITFYTLIPATITVPLAIFPQLSLS